ncbi:MAG: isopenicillin N synthase family dioxygenase [Actinomycetes bacterium]
MPATPPDGIPRIDLSGLRDGSALAHVAAQVDHACRTTGCFLAVGHGVDPALRPRLEDLARTFFALDESEKARVAMSRGGRAWRGWFPVGGELTAGRPDRKEGLYFGTDLGPDDPRVAAGLPLHGPNLCPDRPAGLREAVASYTAALVDLGQDVLRAVAVGLGLPPDWFRRGLTADPMVLVRVFRYPPVPAGDESWNVGEHTDYGLLTLLGQDGNEGLEVRTDAGWVPVPADPDAFVVNLGDMLERMTGGAYRSTPHRVRHAGHRDRVAVPLFLDPGWDTEVRPLPGYAAGAATSDGRWDGESVHEWTGTYGDYLLSRVARVFPDLFDDVV